MEYTVKTRIQVSIHPDLVEIAEANMAVKKFSSFSAYLEMLIREEYHRATASNAAAVSAFFDAAAQGRIAPNSSASPAFQAILADAARAAAGHDAPPAQTAAVQLTTYAPRRQAKPRRPSKLKK